MWCSSGPKAGFIWIKDGTKLIPQTFWRLYQRPRIYTIQVVGAHVVNCTEHTAYSSTIKYVSIRLILLIAVKTGLGIMAGDIGNAFYMKPCAEKIWPCCGVEFGTRCGAVVVLKRALYGLKTAPN